MRTNVTIFLEEEVLQKCANHARNIVMHYANKCGQDGSKTYNHNKVDSNVVGVKGEVATEKWLNSFLAPPSLSSAQTQSVVANFYQFQKSNPHAGDISVGTHQIEVKTLRPDHWSRFKRMIPPGQLKAYVKKDAIVVWAVASIDTYDHYVYLQGWNYARDVMEKGIPVKTICDNIWLEKDADMRDMRELLEKVQSKGDRQVPSTHI